MQNRDRGCHFRHFLCVIFRNARKKEEAVMSRATLAEKQSQPIRAAVFSTVEETKNAVSRLLAAGLTRQQITVICSDDTKAQYFSQFEHQEQAGDKPPAAG